MSDIRTIKVNDWCKCQCGSREISYVSVRCGPPESGCEVTCTRCGAKGNEISRVWNKLGVEWK